MHFLPLLDEDAVVCRLLRQIVFKEVEQLRGDFFLMDKFEFAQTAELRFEIREIRNFAEEAFRKFPANDGSEFQNLPRLPLQVVEALEDDALDCGWQLCLSALGGCLR